MNETLPSAPVVAVPAATLSRVTVTETPATGCSAWSRIVATTWEVDPPVPAARGATTVLEVIGASPGGVTVTVTRLEAPVAVAPVPLAAARVTAVCTRKATPSTVSVRSAAMPPAGVPPTVPTLV